MATQISLADMIRMIEAEFPDLQWLLRSDKRQGYFGHIFDPVMPINGKIPEGTRTFKAYAESPVLALTMCYAGAWNHKYGVSTQ